MTNDILIVDDEADIRDLVAGILDDEGFATRTARDSDSALAEIANRRPHPDRRALRLGQGIGRTHVAQRVRSRRRTIRRHQRRGDYAGAHGSRAVRYRAIQWRTSTQGRRPGRGPWRNAVYR